MKNGIYTTKFPIAGVGVTKDGKESEEEDIIKVMFLVHDNDAHILSMISKRDGSATELPKDLLHKMLSSIRKNVVST